jgi:glycosyltransferase involved in cell wall biosynthesis
MKSTPNQLPMNPLVGCTIAESTVMPQAVVLATSFLESHPEARFIILLLDGPGDASAGPKMSIYGLRDLGLPAGEEWRLPMLYANRELAWVVKPALLQTLLKGSAAAVVYFEYSTLILGSLTSAELPDDQRAIVATEEVKNEFGDSGRSFVAVRPGAETALGSWFVRQANDSVPLAAAFDGVPHSVVSSPGFAVAYWNLDPTSLTSSPNGYEISGQPLRSFDFRGYDPDKPHLLSKYQGFEPRILLSEHPAIARLCDEYRGRLLQAGYERRRSHSPLTRLLPSGLPIDHRMMRLYRQGLDKFGLGEGPEPPSPFGAGGEEGFLRWLNEPVGPAKAAITRYMLAVFEEREDVRNAFPEPLGADAAGFRDWYLFFGRRELGLPDAVVPNDPRVNEVAAATVTVPVVNVAGYFRAELGIGVAARSLLTALAAAGIPFNTISFNATANRQDYPFTDRIAEAGGADINIVCVNPDQLSLFAEQTGPEFRHGRYTIGVWFWEVEDFPESFHGAFNYVDEIWVASDFMRETFLKVSPKPVFKFRLPLLPPQIDPSLSRADLGLPDKFVFLFNFDLLSVLERKNPLGLIQAFSTAFQNAEGPVLVIKTINGDKRCLEMEKIRYAARSRSDIILMEGYLSPLENNTLTALSDCYVSLHRSEGFGLTIAEAMALGKPAVATAYSGNLEFMNGENSFLCPGERVRIGPEREPYPAESYWCEPNVGEASRLLREIYLNKSMSQEKEWRAARDIRERFSPSAAGQMIYDRLAKIRRRRKATGPVRSIAFLEEQLEELEGQRRANELPSRAL